MAGEQENVKVLRVSSVVPAIPTLKHRMFLSSLDVFFISIKNQRVMFYKIDEQEMDFCTIAENLKRSLSLVLVEFYPLAGRLDIKGEESGRPAIDCNDGGVEFVEASIRMAFEELVKEEFRHKNFFKERVRNHDRDTSENGTYDGPLLSIQVTAFLGGGICIGTNFHHVIADGCSFWHFMKCWAECSRGLPVSNKPEHMREIFKRDENLCALPNVSWRAEEVVTEYCMKEAQIFKFVRDVPLPMNHSEIKVSTDNTTTENVNESSAPVAAEFGGRVRPPLPPTYFVNCLCVGLARTSAKQLLEQDVCFAASLIQELINSCTMEIQLNNLLDWVYSNQSAVISNLVETLGVCRYSAAVAGSPKFAVYEIEHGWGKPLNVQPPYLRIGIISLIRGKDENGGRSIDVSTCLPLRQMDALKQIVMIVPP
eukprot:PITA_24350